MAPSPTVGVWFRRSIRLHDNAALCRACELGNVIPIFILDPHFVEPHRIGVNQFSFFLQGLEDLDAQLRSKGSRLIVLRGTPEKIWKDVFEGKHPFKLTHLVWERDTTPYSRKRDAAVSSLAAKHKVRVEHFPGHTLLDIDAMLTQPNFKAPTNNKSVEAMVTQAKVGKPLSVPKIPACKIAGYPMFKITELGYDSKPTHSAKGGEREAMKILREVCANKAYVSSFNKTKTKSTTGHVVGKRSTTGLSPYLMCGAISVRTVHQSVNAAISGRSHTSAPESLLGQLYFREMFYLLGASNANYDKDKHNTHCLEVDWAKTPALVRAWTDGQTGYPYIDALMRQLKETGWIHHLGRHAVACFLTRGDLWQSWTIGRDVFHKLLIDADGSLNNGNWMALAGVAPWSAPWFRIYSPIPDKNSALNVDQDGTFVKRFVPELKNMPVKYIFSPWTAPKTVQEQAKCIVGKDYPAPIVDHAKARDANLKKFGAAVAKRSQARKVEGAAPKRKAPASSIGNRSKRLRA